MLLELTFLSVRKTKADFFFLNESDTRAQLVGDDVLVFLFGLDRALGRSKHRSVCPSNGFQNKSAVLSIDAIFLKPNSWLMSESQQNDARCLSFEKMDGNFSSLLAKIKLDFLSSEKSAGVGSVAWK